MTDIAARLDRLESSEAIRQLVARYALALDMRDIDAIANLYVEDIRASRTETGRAAMKAVFGKVLRTFTTSVHHVGGHVFEFDDPDHAHGIVYTRAEHEIGDKWCPMYLYYLDQYKRVDGRWYFKRRIASELYVCDINERPVGPNKIRWPGRPDHEGNWHAHFPTWADFWADPQVDLSPLKPEPKPDSFIDDMRRGDRKIIPPDFSWAEKQQG